MASLTAHGNSSSRDENYFIDVKNEPGLDDDDDSLSDNYVRPFEALRAYPWVFNSSRDSLEAVFKAFEDPFWEPLRAPIRSRESLEAVFKAFEDPFWEPFKAPIRSRESLTARYDPASHRRLSYPDGGFHQEASSFDDFTGSISSRWHRHITVVHIHNTLNSQHNTMPLSNQPRVIITETFLGITSQAALTMLTMWKSSSTGFSQNAKILFCSAVAFNVIGFLCCLFAILLRGRKPRFVARMVTGTGLTFTAYGFLAIMGILLNDNIMLWATGFACVACFPALASAFMK